MWRACPTVEDVIGNRMKRLSSKWFGDQPSAGWVVKQDLLRASQPLNCLSFELPLEVRGSSKQSRWKWATGKNLMCVFVNREHQLSLVFLFNKTIGDILKKMKLSDVGVGKKLEIIKNTASYSHTLWSNWSW